jgi:hypothetical protein
MTVSSRLVVVGGTARKVTAHYACIGGSARLVDSFTPPFSASADTQSAFGSSYSPKPKRETVLSNTVNITPVGGTLPYSYVWTKIDGDAGVAAVSPQSASTAFQASLNNMEVSADFQWTVSDAFGSSASGSVSVTLSQQNGVAQ